MNTNNKENNNVTGVIRTTNNKQHQHFGSSLFEQLVSNKWKWFEQLVWTSNSRTGLEKSGPNKWFEQVV